MALVAALVLTVVGLPPGAPQDALALTTIGFDADPRGEILLSSPGQPRYLTTEFRSMGVVFPDGLELYRCGLSTDCIAAHYGLNVARPMWASEWAREPLTITFEAPQRYVSMWIRSDWAAFPSFDVRARLEAFGSSSTPLASTERSFTSRDGWQHIAVEDPARRDTIRSVTLTGGEVGLGFDRNLLVIDDLIFNGAPIPVPTPDTVDPTVSIDSPYVLPGFERAGSVVIGQPTLHLEVTVQDDRDLWLVSALMTDEVGTLVARRTFCSPSEIGPCPIDAASHQWSNDVDLAGLANGTYQLEVTACDGASNCGFAGRSLLLDVPPPALTTDIRPVVMGVELNQYVQSRIEAAPTPGTTTFLVPDVPLLGGKDTAIRFYLADPGGLPADFVPSLAITVRPRVPSAPRHWVIRPNGPAIYRMPPYPRYLERERWLAIVRQDLRLSYNYVIPGTALADAETMEMKLVSGSTELTGRAQVRFSHARIGLNIVRLSFRDNILRLDPGAEDAILPYLRAAYPVSDVRILSTRSMTVSRTIANPFVPNGCTTVRWQVWLAYGGDDAPVRRFPEDPFINIGGDPTIIPTVGVVTDGALSWYQPGLLGCAALGDPTDGDDRIGGVVISEADGVTAAHEIGHVLGLRHHSGHGESGSSGWSAHEHGNIGDHDYTVAMVPDAPADRANPLGTWSVVVVDPCPDADNYPTCDLPADSPNRPHDLMSYGPNTRMSAQTTQRIWDAITLGRYGSSRAEGSGIAWIGDVEAGESDSLMVQVELTEDGLGTLLPVLRKHIASVPVHNRPDDRYALLLVGAAGEVLAEHLTDASTTDDEEASTLRAIVPHVPGLARIVVTFEGKPIVEADASHSSPVASAISPKAGQAFGKDDGLVSWDVADADGDPIWSLVQYSPDAGETWQTVEVVPPGVPTEVTLRVDELPASRFGKVRVTVSDGINTSASESECLFGLGFEEAADCGSSPG